MNATMEKENTDWLNEERGADAELSGDDRVERVAQLVGQGGSRAVALDLRVVPIGTVRPHPLNPRLFRDEELIVGVQESAKERGTYDETQPLIVREVQDHLQLFSGHHRLEGYERAGLPEVLVHVVHADDREAMLGLERYNRQNPLGSLELALHAGNLIDQGIARDQAEAAELLGLSAQQLSRFLSALRVFRAHQASCAGSIRVLRDRAEHLYMLRGLPHEAQEVLIKEIIEQDLSKAAVRKLVEKHNASKAVSASSKAPVNAPLAAADRDAPAKGVGKVNPEAVTSDQERARDRVESEPALNAPADVLRLHQDFSGDDFAVERQMMCTGAPPNRALMDTMIIKLSGHLNTIGDSSDLTLYPFPGPLPCGLTWHVEDGKLFLGVPRASMTPDEDQEVPLRVELPAPQLACEPTRETVSVTLPKAFETLPQVEVTEEVLSCLRKLGIAQPVLEARELGTSDVYEAVFGKNSAAWFRGVIESPSTKAKEALRKLKIRHTEKVTMTTPRHDLGGRPVVLLLDEDILGVGVYDKQGKAPCGQVAVLAGNHVVFVDAEQLDCDEALVFRDHKPCTPDSIAVSESPSAV